VYSRSVRIVVAARAACIDIVTVCNGRATRKATMDCEM
jgi:hypothetical protein